MKLTILGAAAGGGLPQWNCGCPNCADARAGRIPAMTQSSVALTLDGRTETPLDGLSIGRFAGAALPVG